MLKKLFLLFSVGIILLVVILAVCYGIISRNASGRTYDSAVEIPHNKYGVLLATSPITRNGLHNIHFDNRIKAADQLFKQGKIDYIIASGGDYSGKEKYGCNEPEAIRDSLIIRGIPPERILLDFEGRRTLNSVLNSKYVYNLDSVTFISQKFHNERAIYLADKNDLYAIGYNAENSPIFSKRIKNTVREIFARPKVFIDLMTGI